MYICSFLCASHSNWNWTSRVFQDNSLKPQTYEFSMFTFIWPSPWDRQLFTNFQERKTKQKKAKWLPPSYLQEWARAKIEMLRAWLQRQGHKTITSSSPQVTANWIITSRHMKKWWFLYFFWPEINPSDIILHMVDKVSWMTILVTTLNSYHLPRTVELLWQPSQNQWCDLKAFRSSTKGVILYCPPLLYWCTLCPVGP